MTSYTYNYHKNVHTAFKSDKKLALPTSVPITHVLGCRLTSYFGYSKIPIHIFWYTHLLTSANTTHAWHNFNQI